MGNFLQRLAEGNHSLWGHRVRFPSVVWPLVKKIQNSGIYITVNGLFPYLWCSVLQYSTPIRWILLTYNNKPKYFSCSALIWLITGGVERSGQACWCTLQQCKESLSLSNSYSCWASFVRAHCASALLFRGIATNYPVFLLNRHPLVV